MCGRYTLELDKGRISGLFGVDDFDFELFPRYNIAPSQAVAVIGLKPGGTKRGLAMLNWGLVPRWAREPNDGPKPINARAETLLEKPTFRESFQKRRCLLPATGFFEWKRVGKRKEAYLFRQCNLEPFAFAGIWDTWSDGTRKLATCSIITVTANDLVRPLHDRMPAILPAASFTAWLATATPMEDVMNLLKPYPVELMESVAVGTTVNAVANDSPECIVPIEFSSTLI